MRKILLFLLSICALHADFDKTQIDKHSERLAQRESRRAALIDAAGKLGAAAVAGFVVHFVYNSVTTPKIVGDSSWISKIQENPGIIEKIFKENEALKNSWWNSMYAWPLKVVGTIVAQSLVVQGLQPFFTKFKGYFVHECYIPAQTSWFLIDQSDNNPGKMVTVTHDLSDFLQHLNGLESGYEYKDAGVVQECAQFILGHMAYVRSCKIEHSYQLLVLNKIEKKIAELFETLCTDSQNGVYDYHKIDSYKGLLRQLYVIPAYCPR